MYACFRFKLQGRSDIQDDKSRVAFCHAYCLEPSSHRCSLAIVTSFGMKNLSCSPFYRATWRDGDIFWSAKVVISFLFAMLPACRLVRGARHCLSHSVYRIVASIGWGARDTRSNSQTLARPIPPFSQLLRAGTSGCARGWFHGIVCYSLRHQFQHRRFESPMIRTPLLRRWKLC